VRNPHFNTEGSPLGSCPLRFPSTSLSPLLPSLPCPTSLHLAIFCPQIGAAIYWRCPPHCYGPASGALMPPPPQRRHINNVIKCSFLPRHRDTRHTSSSANNAGTTEINSNSSRLMSACARAQELESRTTSCAQCQEQCQPQYTRHNKDGHARTRACTPTSKHMPTRAKDSRNTLRTFILLLIFNTSLLLNTASNSP